MDASKQDSGKYSMIARLTDSFEILLFPSKGAEHGNRLPGILVTVNRAAGKAPYSATNCVGC